MWSLKKKRGDERPIHNVIFLKVIYGATEASQSETEAILTKNSINKRLYFNKNKSLRELTQVKRKDALMENEESYTIKHGISL